MADVECDECDGTGTCGACQGDDAECEMCDGTGSCPECDGDGVLYEDDEP